MHKLELVVGSYLPVNFKKNKCSIKGVSFGSMNYTSELKTVACTSFLGQKNIFFFQMNFVKGSP